MYRSAGWCYRLVRQRRKAHGILGSAAKRVMGPPLVAEGEGEPEAGADGCDGLAGVDLLVLEGVPEPLGEHVVPPAALAVHADPDLVGPQHSEKVRAGERRALIGVEDFRPTEALERLLTAATKPRAVGR